jgi:hypothetical protein
VRSGANGWSSANAQGATRSSMATRIALVDLVMTTDQG